jgi:hypothetical protein
MRKSVMTLAVASVFALPTMVLAQAAPAPAAPTLDKVLEASGLSLSGYVDTAYQHANRNIEAPNFSTRVFDSQNNSFVLHQVGLQMAKQPKEGFGGLVNITAGKDAQVIHSFPENSAASNSLFDITQAYAQYAMGAFTLIAGKFTTLHGTEVIWSPSNANFSRSILFGSVPFTHTGVRGVYTMSDMVNFTVGVNNGWDQLQDANKGKTLELGTTVTPIKPLTISASYYGGQEPSATTLVNGRRDSFNLVGSYSPIEPLSLGLEYLRVQQKDAVLDGSGTPAKGKYSGFAGYVSYTFMPKLKATVRAETFDDKDRLRFGPTAVATKYKEYTLTLAYLAADNFELRGEIRTDRANEATFADDSNLSKTLTTFAVQALYKF